MYIYIFIYFCLPPECLLFYISPRDLVTIMGSIEKEGTKIYDTLAGVQGEGNKGLLKDVEDFSFYHNTHSGLGNFVFRISSRQFCIAI